MQDVAGSSRVKLITECMFLRMTSYSALIRLNDINYQRLLIIIIIRKFSIDYFLSTVGLNTYNFCTNEAKCKNIFLTLQAEKAYGNVR